MSNRWAILQGDIVQNVVAWDGNTETWQPDGEAIELADTDAVGPGDIRQADGTFTRPPPPVPASVTPLQMRKALRIAGLKPTVDGYIATLSEEVQEAWEYATAVDRDNQLIGDAATGLGMTVEDVDNLFRIAASQ